jgi:hypothetical protein
MPAMIASRATFVQWNLAFSSPAAQRSSKVHGADQHITYMA